MSCTFAAPPGTVDTTTSSSAWLSVTSDSISGTSSVASEGISEGELGWLDQEVSIPNSQASYDYVFKKLDVLDRKLVSLALPSALTARLNDICGHKRIVRDAFFNRLFLMLAASPKVIDRLFFNDVADEWRGEVWSENKHNGPFFQNGFYPLEPIVDPFWAIRSGLEMYAADAGHEDYVEPASGETIRVARAVITGEVTPVDSLYTRIFDLKVQNHDLIGMSCHVPDWRIPGHGAEVEHQAKLDELLGSLELLS